MYTKSHGIKWNVKITKVKGRERERIFGSVLIRARVICSGARIVAGEWRVVNRGSTANENFI